MMAEKYIISLIVECADPSSLKLRFIVKECSEHACYYPPKASPEVVEDYFWPEEKRHNSLNGAGGK